MIYLVEHVSYVPTDYTLKILLKLSKLPKVQRIQNKEELEDILKEGTNLSLLAMPNIRPDNANKYLVVSPTLASKYATYIQNAHENREWVIYAPRAELKRASSKFKTSRLVKDQNINPNAALAYIRQSLAAFQEHITPEYTNALITAAQGDSDRISNTRLTYLLERTAYYFNLSTAAGIYFLQQLNTQAQSMINPWDIFTALLTYPYPKAYTYFETYLQQTPAHQLIFTLKKGLLIMLVYLQTKDAKTTASVTKSNPFYVSNLCAIVQKSRISYSRIVSILETLNNILLGIRAGTLGSPEDALLSALIKITLPPYQTTRA